MPRSGAHILASRCASMVSFASHPKWCRAGTTWDLELDTAVARIRDTLELACGEPARALRADRIDAPVSLRGGLTVGGHLLR